MTLLRRSLLLITPPRRCLRPLAPAPFFRSRGDLFQSYIDVFQVGAPVSRSLRHVLHDAFW